jgi:hypothetical protein
MIGVILGILALWLLLLYPQILVWFVLAVCVIWLLVIFPWMWLVIGVYVCFNLLVDMQ